MSAVNWKPVCLMTISFQLHKDITSESISNELVYFMYNRHLNYQILPNIIISIITNQFTIFLLFIILPKIIHFYNKFMKMWKSYRSTQHKPIKLHCQCVNKIWFLHNPSVGQTPTKPSSHLSILIKMITIKSISYFSILKIKFVYI